MLYVTFGDVLAVQLIFAWLGDAADKATFVGGFGAAAWYTRTQSTSNVCGYVVVASTLPGKGPPMFKFRIK